MQVTTVTTKGQVTIPRDIRASLGIQAGDRVMFTSLTNGSAVVSAVPRDVVGSLFGSLMSKVRGTDHSRARKIAGRTLAKKYQIP